MLTNPIMSPDEPGPPGYQEYEFETLMVDDTGEIRERRSLTARQFVEDLGNGIHLHMTLIPGGTFLMGARPGEGYDDERPQHNVRVAGFLIGTVPVTQEQWQAVMERIPPYRFKGARRPADRVSWDDAVAFCERLTRKTGRAYRLPGEAEWEYACRAHSTTPFSCGETLTTDQANYVGEHTFRAEPKGSYRHVTLEVGSLPPNPFGLYDMHGGLWEWCADAWHEDYRGAPLDGSTWQGRSGSARVLRGGCWHDPPGLCRSAARLQHVPHEGEDFFGFRVALSSLEALPQARHDGNGGQIARHIRDWLHL